jgi:hypothetical protein
MNQAVHVLATKAYDLSEIPAERGSFLADKVCFHQSGHHVQYVYDAIKSRVMNDCWNIISARDGQGQI